LIRRRWPMRTTQFSGSVRKRFAAAGRREKLGLWPQRHLELRDEDGSLVLCWSYKRGDESHGRLTLHNSTLLEAVPSKPRQIRICNPTPHAAAASSPVALTIECPSVANREAWQSAISQALRALPIGLAAAIREDRFDAAELYSIFPDVDESVVEEALRACGGDKHSAVERVIDMLRDRELGPPEECVVCFDAPRQTRFSCGHACCCIECSDTLLAMAGARCPMCREPISLSPYTTTMGVELARQPTWMRPPSRQPTPQLPSRQSSGRPRPLLGRCLSHSRRWRAWLFARLRCSSTSWRLLGWLTMLAAWCLFVLAASAIDSHPFSNPFAQPPPPMLPPMPPQTPPLQPLPPLEPSPPEFPPAPCLPPPTPPPPLPPPPALTEFIQLLLYWLVSMVLDNLLSFFGAVVAAYVYGIDIRRSYRCCAICILSVLFVFLAGLTSLVGTLLGALGVHGLALWLNMFGLGYVTMFLVAASDRGPWVMSESRLLPLF